MGAGGATRARADAGPAQRLIDKAQTDGRAFALATHLADEVGPRPSGSLGAAKAVAWAVAQMKALGLKNVHTEPVRTARWLRGTAEAELIAGDTRQTLHVAALGPSVATAGNDGLTADLVEVASYDELRARGEAAVRGKIVLFNPAAMQRAKTFSEYGRVVAFRAAGAVMAARLGAAAVLVRSAGTGAYRQPHTGALFYDPAVPKIPAAAVAIEDADLIHRLGHGGAKLRVRLKLTPRLETDVDSANVVGEVPGTSKKDEVVLLGAHLDSWDLGTGAVDDAAGCAIAMDAARLVATAAGRAPKRTIRVVLFMNEEMGLSGAKAYAERHAAELSKHVAALEVDSGEGRPLGWGALGGPAAVALLTRLAAPLEAIGAARVSPSDEGGADLGPIAGKVPMLNLDQDLTYYFDWHHTAADTADKLDARDMALNAAAVSVMAWGLADAAETLPMSPVSKHYTQPQPGIRRIPVPPSTHPQDPAPEVK